MTFQEIKDKCIQIRDEYRAMANTAYRVGSAMLDTITKVEEIANDMVVPMNLEEAMVHANCDSGTIYINSNKIKATDTVEVWRYVHGKYGKGDVRRSRGKYMGWYRAMTASHNPITASLEEVRSEIGNTHRYKVNFLFPDGKTSISAWERARGKDFTFVDKNAALFIKRNGEFVCNPVKFKIKKNIYIDPDDGEIITTYNLSRW